MRRAAAGVFVAACLAGSGLIVGYGWDGSSSPHRLAALTPTSTLGATGCRFADGSRGPCDPLSAFCEAATSSKAPNCDIDGQPRIDRNPSQGCTANTIPDAGADEFYAPGCEPLVGATTVPTTTASSTTAPTTTAPPPPPAIEVAYRDFRTNLPAGTLYKAWAKANPGEAGRFEAYAGAVDHGETETAAPPPGLSTFTGRALVAAAHERQVGK